ncbi:MULTISPECIES: ATP-dependent DNA helicase DinG [unclassified Niallia]|uniref:ATP-dependent DNA helicase DinG n=1 Tax=Niallia TaxID=2837506 RepID=UPI001EDA30F1|nr:MULTISPECIES: ATP-dependent DNA helicase DinG [unclassified Niallia]MCM3031386.1 ATP-dependent DNA helicase DinG [Niallia sp. MER 6]MDL0435777.1 ATP-dependent DNA helicase DinG [Niallia sp. SS-2023]UPO86394.1 ATP-dependent DNA helicase DinG [Niallia sp. Man26]
MGNKYVVVDLETNGNSPKKGDRIIQFAAVVIEDGKIVEEYSSLLNPLQPISPFIEELTGINDEMVEAAPLFEEIAEKVQSLLKDAYFVAHNVMFDLTFLSDELEQAGFEAFYGPIIDTVEMARILFPTADSYKLTDLAIQENIEHNRPHQADSDAYVTAELLLIMLNKIQGLPLATIRQLEGLSGALKSDLDQLLDNIAIQKESKLPYIREGLELYRGLALRSDEKDKSAKSKQEYIDFDRNEVENRMTQVLPNYVTRLGQQEMITDVLHCFQTDLHGLIEAGTGVGKSLAYLIAAAFFAKKENKQIVVSTFTTQLQEQLTRKDLPLLAEILPFAVGYTVLKGRNHYISLDKFEVSLKEQDDNYDVILTKMQILIWLTETKTGDKDELNLSSGGMKYWHKIKNDGNFSLSFSKEWAPKDFYRRTRNAAQKADIIITNHALLLQDLSGDKGLLPNYEYAVIDEGHHFEKNATKHFGHQFSYFGTKMSIQSIGTYEQKQLFYKLYSKEKNLEYTDKKKLNRLLSDLPLELEELFRTIFRYAKKTGGKSNSPKASIRIKRDDSIQWQQVEIVAERFIFLLKDCKDAIIQLVDALYSTHDAAPLSADQVMAADRIKAIMDEWDKYMLTLRHIFLREEDSIAWLEVDWKNFPNQAILYAQPHSVAEILQQTLFARKKSVVFASATLTVNNHFEYYANGLGLSSIKHLEKQIPSPFEYDKQVRLIVPDEVPDINNVPLDEYIEAVTGHIISIAEATSGRMLILFTSNEMLKKTYEMIKARGSLPDYAILAQGITTGSRMRLTRNFQRYDKAILLGTNSFWEGIDIPGEDLTCLIIVRLPFSSPDEPLNEAKNERIKSMGGNPFLENSLPEAVLRFKQGFGRLIRTETDKGFIVILDRRIITTTYGELFLESIPKVPVIRKKLDEIEFFIKEWI